MEFACSPHAYGFPLDAQVSSHSPNEDKVNRLNTGVNVSVNSCSSPVMDSVQHVLLWHMALAGIGSAMD